MADRGVTSRQSVVNDSEPLMRVVASFFVSTMAQFSTAFMRALGG